MARQCIYCGRTLQPGEVCNCRSGGGTGTSARTAEPTTGTGTGTGSAEKKTSGPGTAGARKQPGAGTRKSARAKKTWFRDASGKSRTRTPPPRSGSTRTSTGAGARSFAGIGVRMRVLLKRYAGFVRTPVDTAVSFAEEPGYEAILLLVGLEAVAAGILAAVGYRSALFYLSFSMLGLTMQGATSVWSAALLAALQSVVRLTVLSGVFYLYFRFLLRVRTGFRDIAAAVAPASAPMTVLMLIACFSASSATATPLATLTLVLGLLMGVLLMFFTFRRLLGLGDNQTLLLLLFGHLLYFSVLSLLVGSFRLLA